MKKKPLYQTIYDTIVEKINKGEYPVGNIIPSENELEKIFHGSRTPIRQALKQLENDGYIYRLQGKGSFVANRHPAGRWTLMTGFRDQYNQDWQRIFAKTLVAKRIQSPLFAERLQLKNTTEVIYLKRIRFYDGEPVLYLEHYIAPHFSLDLFTEDASFLSVGQILKEKVNLDFVQSEEEIEAAAAGEEVAKYLRIERQSPVLKVTRISYDSRLLPIDINVYYTRSDKWKYLVKYKSE